MGYPAWDLLGVAEVGHGYLMVFALVGINRLAKSHFAGGSFLHPTQFLQKLPLDVWFTMPRFPLISLSISVPVLHIGLVHKVHL